MEMEHSQHLAGSPNEAWVLRLYVDGQTPTSLRAFANLKRLCDDYLAGRHRIEVLNVQEAPQLALEDGILTVPALVRKWPLPIRRLAGDLADEDRVLTGLDLWPAGIFTTNTAIGETPSDGLSRPPVDRSAEFEYALIEDDDQRYLLRLYVAGLSPRSQRAIANIKAVCEQHLAGRYELEVIDIYRKPALAIDERIIAVPTLLKRFPPPLRKVIGDLSNQEALLFGLDLKPQAPPTQG